MVLTSQSAECTAWRDSTTPSAPASAMGPSTQKTTASPVPICTSSAAAASTLMPAPRAPAPRLAASGGPPPGRRRSTPARRRLAGGRRLRVADVVALLVVAEPHRVRGLLHPGQQRGHQLLLGVDQGLPVVVGQLEVVAHGQ